MVASTGWTFEQVDATDLCDGLALLNYYSEFPPIHELVRAYVGFEGPVVTMETKAETQFVQSLPTRPYDSIPADLRALMEAHKVN